MKYLLIFISLLLLSGCFYIDEDFRREPDLVRKAGGTIIALEWWYKNPNNKNSKSFGSGTESYGAAAEKYKDNYIVKWISQFTEEEIPASDLYKVKKSNKHWKKTYTKEQYMKSMVHNREVGIKKTLCIDDPRYNEFSLWGDNGKLLQNGKLSLFEGGYWAHTDKTRVEFEKEVRSIEIVDDWENDSNQFYYEKDEKGNFIVYDWISDVMPHLKEVIIPIKQCFSDGWCLTYKDFQGKDLYVKKEALYK